MVGPVSLRGTVPWPTVAAASPVKLDLTSLFAVLLLRRLALPGTNKQQSTSNKPHKLS